MVLKVFLDQKHRYYENFVDNGDEYWWEPPNYRRLCRLSVILSHELFDKNYKTFSSDYINVHKLYYCMYYCMFLLHEQSFVGHMIRQWILRLARTSILFPFRSECIEVQLSIEYVVSKWNIFKVEVQGTSTHTLLYRSEWIDVKVMTKIRKRSNWIYRNEILGRSEWTEVTKKSKWKDRCKDLNRSENIDVKTWVEVHETNVKYRFVGFIDRSE